MGRNMLAWRPCLPKYGKPYDQALTKAQVHRSTKVVFNGRTYDSLDEMPAEERSQYEQVMAMLDKDHDGIPDMLETGQAATLASVPDGNTLMEAAPLTSKPVQAPENRGRSMALILIGLLALVHCGISINIDQDWIALSFHPKIMEEMHLSASAQNAKLPLNFRMVQLGL